MSKKKYRPINPNAAQLARYGSNAKWYRYVGRTIKVDRIAMLTAGCP